MDVRRSDRIVFGFIIFLIGVFMLLQFGLNFLDFKTYVGIILLVFGAYQMTKD